MVMMWMFLFLLFFFFFWYFWRKDVSTRHAFRISYRRLPNIFYFCRFGEVALDPTKRFSITCKLISQILSPETTYACYLVYKLPELINSDDLLYFEFPLKVKDENFHDENDWEMSHSFRFIYLLSPQTPVIRPKVDQNSHNPLNRPKLKGIPRPRDDGWMEVQVCEFQPSTSTEPKLMRADLDTVFPKTLKGLTVQGVEFRPEYISNK